MHTVLVVDDDPRVCDLLVLLLHEEMRCHALTAMRGRAAVDLAITHQPDALLLDVRLPDLDGFAVCHELKAQPATTDLPIIFITGDHDTAIELRALACGAADYVRKPFEVEVLLARLHRVLTERDRRAAALRENVALRARLHSAAPHHTLPWLAGTSGSTPIPVSAATPVLIPAGAARHQLTIQAPVATESDRRRGRPRLTTVAFAALDKAVLAELIAGQSEREIAEALGLGLRTVERRVNALKRHFGVTTVALLVAQIRAREHSAQPS